MQSTEGTETSAHVSLAFGVDDFLRQHFGLTPHEDISAGMDRVVRRRLSALQSAVQGVAVGGAISVPSAQPSASN